jgi:hypothetical protein
MSARIDRYSLKNQSQDPYFSVAPQTTAEVSAPKKTVHWDRVAIVAAIGLAMVSAYLLSRGMFDGPQIICKTKPILLSEACPKVMKVLEESCAPNPCLNLAACDKWKIGQIDWYTKQLICPETTNCNDLLERAQMVGQMYEEPLPNCIIKPLSEACSNVFNYLQTACNKVLSPKIRGYCNDDAKNMIKKYTVVRDCFCGFNCENYMKEAKDKFFKYEAWNTRVSQPGHLLGG